MPGRGTYPGLGSRVIPQLLYNVKALATCEMGPTKPPGIGVLRMRLLTASLSFLAALSASAVPLDSALGKRQIQTLSRGAVEVFSRIASTPPLLLRTGFAKVCGELTRGYRHSHHLNRSGQQCQL